MAELERTFTPEFHNLKPPVIPVKFTRPKGRGKPSPLSLKGWDGFKLAKIGGAWRVMTEPDMTLKCLGDGYAEIPATKNNKALLAVLSKPMKVSATYDRGVSRDKVDPEKFWFKNNKGVSTPLTKKAIEDGEIKIIENEHELPPVVSSVGTRREFDIHNNRTNDSELCQRIRPWLLEFVKVNGAQMEAENI